MYCELPRKKVFKNQNGLLINQYLIDTIQDISTLPTQISKPAYDRCAAGSTAYCIENQNYYILNNNNEWLVYDENGEGSNNSINKKIKNDITFYDYDGTIIESYSASDFMKLNSLPENPNRSNENLVAQGWNWSLEDAKEYVEIHKKLDIGQMYTPIDNNMHIFIKIPENYPSSYPVTLYLYTDSPKQIIINWGDNSPSVEEPASEQNIQYSHTYTSSGEYEIIINSILKNINEQAYPLIEKIFFAPDNNYLSQIEYNVISKIKKVVIPKGITNINESKFSSCNLQTVIIPNSVTNIGEEAFNYCIFLQNIIIPNSVTNIGIQAFGSCVSLQNITIPNSITGISSSMFSGCKSLRTITIPNSVTGLGDGPFSQNILIYYFKPTTPPTLAMYSSSGVNQKAIFYVPADSLEDYKTNNNVIWHNYANTNRIFAEPE